MSKTYRPARLGVILLLVTFLMFVLLFSKGRISTALSSGQTITAHFDGAYKLRKFVSVVKVGFVPVGKVKDVQRADDGSAIVSLKVDKDVLKTLGSKPTATIRSTTLLGGSYFVELTAGGDPGAFTASSIPASRTKLPVELDKVARALQPAALDGLQATVGGLDQTLAKGGDDALKRLVENAPDTLQPLGRVLGAARGERPTKDLTQIVSGLESTGRVLTRTDGQVDAILSNLDSTAAVLAGRSTEIGSALDALPATLDNTEAGLADLDSTLATLRDVAGDARPIAKELDKTLETLDPVLKKARPLVADLEDLAKDARPVVAGLVPSAQIATTALQDVKGPVINRVNGPVTTWLYEPYKGTGEYAMTTTKKAMYQEITYTLVDLDRAASLTDRNGHGVGFQPGIGSGSIGGLPISIEQLTKGLTSWLYTDKPIDTLPPLDGRLTDLLNGDKPFAPGAGDAPAGPLTVPGGLAPGGVAAAPAGPPAQAPAPTPTAAPDNSLGGLLSSLFGGGK